MQSLDCNHRGDLCPREPSTTEPLQTERRDCRLNDDDEGGCNQRDCHRPLPPPPTQYLRGARRDGRIRAQASVGVRQKCGGGWLTGESIPLKEPIPRFVHAQGTPCMCFICTVEPCPVCVKDRPCFGSCVRWRPLHLLWLTHHANSWGSAGGRAGAALACTCACTCGASAAAVGGALRCGMCSRRGTVLWSVGRVWVWVQRVRPMRVAT